MNDLDMKRCNPVFRRPTMGLPLLAALFCFAAPAAAGWDEAQKLHDQANSTSDPIEAARLLCEASEKRPKDKNYKQDCDSANIQVNATLKKFDNLMISGKTLMGQGKKDAAREKFEKILWGPHLEEAQRYLAPGGMPDVKPSPAPTAVAKVVEDPPSYGQGMTAFYKGEYESAKMSLSQVPADAPSKSKADDALKTIASYNSKLNDARGLEQQKLYPGAQQAYLAAAGMAVGKAAAEAQARANDMAVLAAVRVDQSKSVPPSVARSTPQRPVVPGASGPTPPPVPETSDNILSRGMKEFYDGDIESIKKAEGSLQDYLESNGLHKGAAYFYLGASKLAHYYLLDSKQEQAARSDLERQALENFKKAKAVKGFAPPEKYVSPKILEEYKKAG